MQGRTARNSSPHRSTLSRYSAALATATCTPCSRSASPSAMNGCRSPSDPTVARTILRFNGQQPLEERRVRVLRCSPQRMVNRLPTDPDDTDIAALTPESGSSAKKSVAFAKKHRAALLIVAALAAGLALVVWHFHGGKAADGRPGGGAGPSGDNGP